MYRNNYSPNPHGSAPPFTPGEGQFRSPGPRFFQQAVPHHGGPGGPSPHMTPPHKGQSPRGHYDRNFTPRGHLGYNQWTPNFNSGSHRGRGYSPRHSSPFTPGRGRGGYNSGNYRHDSNPGGSNDITVYYKPSMIFDPWSNTNPVSVGQASQSHTSDFDQSNSNSESS